MIRPSKLEGKTVKVKTGCGNMYLTVNFHEGQPYEMFCYLGKPGGCISGQNEAVARLVSLCFRLGGSVESIIKQLKGISCPQGVFVDGIRIESCADAIAYALRMATKKGG